jgi:hypothetical protein
VKKLLFIALAIGAGAAVAAEWPSIQRYLKIKAM